MKEYVMYGTESGEIYRTKNLVDMYKTSKEIKRYDKEYKLEQSYYYEMEEEQPERDERGHKVVYAYDVKIYRRGNKIYCRTI